MTQPPMTILMERITYFGLSAFFSATLEFAPFYDGGSFADYGETGGGRFRGLFLDWIRRPNGSGRGTRYNRRRTASEEQTVELAFRERDAWRVRARAELVLEDVEQAIELKEPVRLWRAFLVAEGETLDRVVAAFSGLLDPGNLAFAPARGDADDASYRAALRDPLYRMLLQHLLADQVRMAFGSFIGVDREPESDTDLQPSDWGS